MNLELEHLITLVKTSNKSVRETLEDYFKSVIWSQLKDEWACHMTDQQKKTLIKKLEIIKQSAQEKK